MTMEMLHQMIFSLVHAFGCMKSDIEDLKHNAGQQTKREIATQERKEPPTVHVNEGTSYGGEKWHESQGNILQRGLEEDVD